MVCCQQNIPWLVMSGEANLPKCVSWLTDFSFYCFCAFDGVTGHLLERDNTGKDSHRHIPPLAHPLSADTVFLILF